MPAAVGGEVRARAARPGSVQGGGGAAASIGGRRDGGSQAERRWGLRAVAPGKGPGWRGYGPNWPENVHGGVPGAGLHLFYE